jgi:hypothetical protein
MKAKPPPDRHAFDNDWDEIGYLRDKLLYWLYRRQDSARSRVFAQRLARLLPKADPEQASILGQECWSLIHEARGDLPRAITHREKEIRLIRRLHEISRGNDTESIALNGYDLGDLSDRLDLLAVLCHDNGQIDKAIETLKQSRKVSLENGSKFDGEDLLQEYQDESRAARKAVPTSALARTTKPRSAT